MVWTRRIAVRGGRRSTPRRHAGFTLIELLTTLVIFGVVAGALAASFSSTIRVRRALRSQLDRLEQVQHLARWVRDDLQSLVPVPHSLVVTQDGLSLLRWTDEPWDRERDDAPAPTIVRYRRDPGTASVVRETHRLEPRAWSAWSAASLGDGSGSAVPSTVAPRSVAPVFRSVEPVEWKPLEFGGGEWRPFDGESPARIRALELRIGAERPLARSASERSGSLRDPWTIRIPLPMPLSEEIES